MTFFEWSAQVIDSVAWPASLVILVFLLKDRLSQVLLTISKVKWGNVEVDLSKEIKAIDEIAQTISEERNYDFRLLPSRINKISWVDKALEAASVSPESAILLSWNELEAQINNCAHRLGILKSSRKPINPIYSLQYLIDAGKLSKEDQRLIMRMRQLRNQVAQSGHQETNLTEENVLNFMSQVEYAIERLRSLGS